MSTPLGQKVGISEDVCVDDGYCARIKACPSFERVTITRSRPPASAAAAELAPPPEPAVPRTRGPSTGSTSPASAAWGSASPAAS